MNPIWVKCIATQETIDMFGQDEYPGELRAFASVEAAEALIDDTTIYASEDCSEEIAIWELIK